MFSLDIHVNAIQEKSGEWRDLRWNNAELGESRRSFQTEKNGGKTSGEAPETAFSSFSAGDFPQTENSHKCRSLSRLAETKQPANG